jgi:hypothetical protein
MVHSQPRKFFLIIRAVGLNHSVLAHRNSYIRPEAARKATEYFLPAAEQIVRPPHRARQFGVVMPASARS